MKGLNNSFVYIKSEIMAMDPLPTLNKVFSLTIQYERECVIIDKESNRQVVIASFVGN